MAVQYNPGIVTDGLVLYLDAANPKSYPQTGTGWFDLSGRNNHATLYNGVTFSAGNLFFDGVNDYARTNSTLDLSTTDKITILSSWKTATLSTNVMVYEHTDNWNNVSNGYGGFGLSTNTNGIGLTSGTMHAQARGNVSYNGRNVYEPTSTSFHMYSVIHDFSVSSNETFVYIDGKVATDINSLGYEGTNNTNTAFGNDFLYIGSRGGSNSFGTYTLSSLIIYLKRLNESEVLQNFNALRGRFGI